MGFRSPWRASPSLGRSPPAQDALREAARQAASATCWTATPRLDQLLVNMPGIQQLQHLVAVADRGSLAAAAKALRLTPAALTKSIQRLERELHAGLLDRRTRPAQLTAAGLKVVDRARHGLGVLDAIPAELRRSTGRIEGRVRVGLGPLVADLMLAQLAAELLARAPAVAITARLGHWKDCLEDLKLGRLDLFLGDVTMAEGDPALVTRPFPSVPIAAFCRAGHPLLAERTPSVARVLEFPLVGNTPPAWGVRWLQAQHRRARRPVPAPDELFQVVCDSIHALRQLVATTDALGFAPASAVREGIVAGRLAIAPLDTGVLRSNAGSVVLAARAPSPAALLLRDAAHALAERVVQAGELAR
jgi:DNA-binding transcriptional LysR family regulator